MTPLRVVVVDDEPLALRTLKRLVAQTPDCVVVGACRTAPEAISAIRRMKPDLVLLDIELGTATGLDLVRAVGPEQMPALIFITAHDSHTLDAFDVQALDYVLKPFSDERLSRSLRRAQRRVFERRAALAAGQPASGAVRRFMVRAGGRIVFVKTDHIDWIEADDYYARLHAGPHTHLLRETLSSIESRLDPAQFVRVHRSTIVNLDRVRELELHFKGDCAVVMADGTALPVGRTRRDTLEQRLARRR